MERTFDRTDAIITACAIALGVAIVAVSAWHNRQSLATWANEYRERVGVVTDETRAELLSQEGIPDGA